MVKVTFESFSGCFGETLEINGEKVTPENSKRWAEALSKDPRIIDLVLKSFIKEFQESPAWVMEDLLESVEYGDSEEPCETCGHLDNNWKAEI